MVLQNWVIDCFKMYKIADEVIKFIEETMKNWRVELTAGEKSLTQNKIQQGIFQGEALSPLQFMIAMILLNYILRKCTGAFKLYKSQEKINHLMYIDDIKLKKNRKPQYRHKDIQSEYRDKIWHRKMCHANNEKRKTTEGIELPN